MRQIIITFISIILVISTLACTINIPLINNPTDTPRLSDTATSIPPPTIEPTPAATSTPAPAVRIISADKAFMDGDFDKALDSYQFTFNLTTDPELKAAALTMMGRIYFKQEQTQKALNTFREVTTNFTSPEFLSMAYVYLAEIYNQLMRPAEAAAAYQSYLDLRPGILDSFFQEKKGDALTENGQYSEANDAYSHAISSSSTTPTTSLDLKIAANLARLGDSDSAIQRYLFIQNSTSNDYVKAQTELLIGQLYLQKGDIGLAYEHFQTTVNNYPRSYDSYSALVALVNAGEPVNNLNRGIVDYYANQYGLAIQALDEYEKESEVQDGTTHYYKALSYTAINEYASALDEWNKIIEKYPGDRFWVTAWDEKAYTQWLYLERYDEAAQTLLDFVTTAPQDTLAPGFLFEAGRIYERGDNLDLAALTWERLATEYPSSQQSYTGIYLSGITRYRQLNYGAALSAFQRSLLLASTPMDTASAYLWLGKVQLALGDAESAQTSWQQAVQSDPTGYYSERARDLLINREPFSTCPVFDLAVDLDIEKIEAIAWLKKTFNFGDEVILTGLNELDQDPRFIRGNEFWRLGFLEEASAEFEDLRISRELDAADTFRLTQFFLDIGLYRSAVFSARQVLTLAGMDDAATFNAPLYFNHLRFGTYYRDIIMQASQLENLDPMLLLSLVRQESLFEGFIKSSAGAQGLMQILPSTAREISGNMGWPSVFIDEDIFRPYINIRLGSHYLRQQVDYLNGDIYAALAGYNAGPGNAQFWQNLSGNDYDLYLETVRYQETRQYIRSIVELYNIYRMLYCRDQ